MAPFAAVPEADPPLRRLALTLPQEHAQRNAAWRVEDLQLKDGKLWIRAHIFPAHLITSGSMHVRFDNAPPAASAIWAYNPIEGSDQLVWERRVNQGMATDIEVIGEDFWLAVDRTGLLHQPSQGETEEFGLEAGLLTLNLFAVARQDERLYFGGGIGGDPQLGYLDLPSRQAFRINVPRHHGTNQPPGQSAGGVRQLLSGGDWLLVETNVIQFFNTSTGTWWDGGAPVQELHAIPAPPRDPFQDSQRPELTPAVYDGEAFWMGGRNTLLRFQPGKDAAPVEVAKRRPTAIAFDGELVWAAFSSGAGARRNEVPPHMKPPGPPPPEGAPLVAAWSQAQNAWVVRFPMSYPATSIAADLHTVWLATGDAAGPLWEVDRQMITQAVGLTAARSGLTGKSDTASDPVAALERAAFHGSLDEVQRLISEGALESAAESGSSPLAIAIRRGHVAVIEALLLAGADPNAASPTGDPLLLLASEMRRTDIAALLLMAGANPDLPRETDGIYPLLAAVQEGNPALVGMLLAFNASPDGASNPEPEPGSPASRLSSPLIAAVEQKDRPSVEALLLKGADINRRAAGRTALSAAVVSRDLETARFLLEQGADPNVPAAGGRTPLHLATGLTDDRLFHLLLERGADPSVPSSFGETPLGAAMARGETGRVAILLERLGHPAYRQGNVQRGTDALTRAVQRGDATMVREFLATGVNPNLSSDSRGKPLLLIANEREASLAIFRLLLAFGADPSPQNREHRAALKTGTMPSEVRRTLEEARALSAAAENPMDPFRTFAVWRGMNEQDRSLIEAANRGDVAQVRALLDDGADPDVRDHRGWVPLVHAIRGDHVDVIDLLLSRRVNPNSPTADGSTPLAFAVERADLALARRLLEAGADPDLALYRASHPIHVAATRGNFELIELLIRNGADVHQRAPEGHTALHLAIEQGSLACVELLLAAGADPETSDGKRQRPIELAAAASDSAILKRLLATGASVHPANPRGPTPLEHALFYGRTANAAILRAAGAQERPQSRFRAPSERYVGNGPLPHVRDFDSLRAVIEEKDFDVNAVHGATLLQQFLPLNYDDIRPALYLVERGADVNQLGNGHIFATPPIVMAVENSRSKFVMDSLSDADLITLLRAMLERGANINDRDPVVLWTPLMHAVHQERDQVVEFLLAAGADPELVDIQNKKAVDHIDPRRNPRPDPEAIRRIRELLGDEPTSTSP